MNQLDLVQAASFNCISFILSNNLVNENGSPFEFKDHSFMIDPYLDNTPKQVILKCAQIGYSTMAILRSFHLARFAGANIIHTFPSRNMSKDFVVPKVDPLIARNKVLRDMIGVDSVALKQVGDRYIYYRGSFEQTEAISISAHILINDEYDRSNQQVLKTYRSRLDDAKRERPELGWEWAFSNPSIPGYGVDALWVKSDQKHWFVKCRYCSYDWYLSFPDNIDFDRKIRICAKCHEPLTKTDLKNGRWVYKTKSDTSGYWISQMFVPWISAEQIIEKSQGDQDIFHNFVLGLPFVSKDTSVTREAIIKCLSPGYNPRTNVAIGVDNGVVKHYVIGNRYGIFQIGSTEDWEEIERLRNHFGAIMVIDANPYPNTPQKLASKYPGRVFIHYYQSDKKTLDVIRWDGMVVKSDRTKIIDSVVSEINSKDVVFNLTENALEDYITHWKNVYRIIKDTSEGIKKPVWETIEGRPDHFAHAMVYWRIALEQTIGQGRIATPAPPGGHKGSAFVSQDGTVPALNIEEVLERARNKRGWKSL
ncbi:MAG: hypothetical protein UV58_C0013G0015 [Candidatus Wolfebacteria bacterium GW2011_GWC1_43_10]|uniref:Phage terminase large subunit GpA ATPase domain-containing protein n=1 Tax=Candidatus Wolfebacteria bacterium GW2011_GWC1_43_10 TaxID=1619011 RepID=A0A0G1C921_9BACT|nr:MAG: hypothetical protein UV58_C0013G0015 [Candidatus Wolfebacteria bacterium GW2011_GWC1_43_10]